MVQAKQKLQEYNKNQMMQGQQQIAGAGGDVSQAVDQVQATIGDPSVDAEKIASRGMKKVEGMKQV
jgi:hypothetical protein